MKKRLIMPLLAALLVLASFGSAYADDGSSMRSDSGRDDYALAR